MRHAAAAQLTWVISCLAGRSSSTCAHTSSRSWLPRSPQRLGAHGLAQTSIGLNGGFNDLIHHQELKPTYLPPSQSPGSGSAAHSAHAAGCVHAVYITRLGAKRRFGSKNGGVTTAKRDGRPNNHVVGECQDPRRGSLGPRKRSLRSEFPSNATLSM